MTESHRSFTVWGSSAQKAFAFECPPMPLINTQSTSRSIFSWHLNWQLVTSWQSVDWPISIKQHSMPCLWKFINSWPPVDWVSTKYQWRCWSSVDWNINQGYQLTSNSDALSTHDPTALLVSGSVCILFLNTSIRDCRKIMWVRTLVLSTESEWLPQ